MNPDSEADERRAALREAAKRIWGDGGYRLFLSHRAEYKKEVAELKDRLSLFGISSFVAHRDIQPSRQWQDEIENALRTMHGLAALMTEKFHESAWTDQEVGFALARRVPIFPVDFGTVPYGFIGRVQALRGNWQTCAMDLAKMTINSERMLTAYLQALRDCTSFGDANRLAELLPAIESLNRQEIDELIEIYNANGELTGSFGFNGTRPSDCGQGLVFHLNRLGTRTFAYGDYGRIEVV